MLFYCPNCNKLEVGKVSYTDKDVIFTNARDGYGLMLHYVICQECGYPLSAKVHDYQIKQMDELDSILYWQIIITDYQNGMFSSKNNMLKLIKRKYEKGNLPNKEHIISLCDKFIDKE